MFFSFTQISDMVESEIEALNWKRKPRGLYLPIDYVLSIGGKRLRPALALMTCNLFTDDLARALKVALGLEVFHNFTLMHDDLMDRADLRRGQPTVHRRWNDNVAILSGDAMLILAYRLIARSTCTEKMLTLFSTTAAEICEGQQFDMDFESRIDISIDEYIEMIRLKTAVLLGACLRSGAMAGGASDADADLLSDFGVNLGLAFQIRDDLLDVYGDPALFGKKTGGDILCNKKTFLLVNALNKASAADRTMLLQWFDRNDSPNRKIDFFRNLYDKLEIRRQADEAIAAYYNLATATFDRVSVDNNKKTTLRKVADSLMNRSS